MSVLRGLSVLERRTSTGSEAFSLFTCLDDIKFVPLFFFTLTETIWLKIWAKPPLKNVKVHFRLTCIAQKRLCLKLPMSSLNLSRHLVAQYMSIIGSVELGENPEPPSSYSSSRRTTENFLNNHHLTSTGPYLKVLIHPWMLTTVLFASKTEIVIYFSCEYQYHFKIVLLQIKQLLFIL